MEFPLKPRSQALPIALQAPSYTSGPPLVESANRMQQADLALVNFTPTLFDCDILLELRRHSQLHKLYRVFLI